MTQHMRQHVAGRDRVRESIAIGRIHADVTLSEVADEWLGRLVRLKVVCSSPSGSGSACMTPTWLHTRIPTTAARISPPTIPRIHHSTRSPRRRRFVGTAPASAGEWVGSAGEGSVTRSSVLALPMRLPGGF